MPREKPDVDELELDALQHMADAQAALERDDIGEMEAQILQSRHMEQYCNKMLQVATLKGEAGLIKTMGEHAAKWATATRAATTKRRNDEVPRLIRAMENRKAWARELLGIEEDD